MLLPSGSQLQTSYVYTVYARTLRKLLAEQRFENYTTWRRANNFRRRKGAINYRIQNIQYQHLYGDHDNGVVIFRLQHFSWATTSTPPIPPSPPAYIAPAQNCVQQTLDQLVSEMLLLVDSICQGACMVKGYFV